MASETVDPIDSSHPLSKWAVPKELHVLHGINAAYKLQDLLQQLGLEPASTAMPDQRTACGHYITYYNVYIYIYIYRDILQAFQ